MKKKSILFIYPNMMLGGSTTSLLSILNSIDYKKYTVDILFYNSRGQLAAYLPSEVTVLPFACRYTSTKAIHLRKAVSLKSWISVYRGRVLAKKEQNPWIADQYGSYDNVRYCRKLEKKYDIAISFLEFWPLYYLAEKVEAKRKIAWIHTDYAKLALEKDKEMQALEKLDKVVFISEDCKRDFLNLFSEEKEKAVVVENFLNERLIHTRSEEKVDFQTKESDINFITVCRIDFISKGLDRALDVLCQLQKEKQLEKFHWYIIGTGDDEEKLKMLIKKLELEEKVSLMGGKDNPFPYEKQCDVFFLPSNFEGKPMAVTEAQILGLVPVITDYSSAREQVKNRENGIILENSRNGIYEGLREILLHPEIIRELKEKVPKSSYVGNGKRQWLELLYESGDSDF